MKAVSSLSSPLARIGMGFLTVATLSACAPALAQSLPPAAPTVEKDKGTLQVSGRAQLQLPADQVTITLAVETESPSAREASAMNAQRMAEVMGALRGADSQGMEIETFGYSLSPEYRRPTQQDPSSQVISGYRAMNNIRVTLQEVERAGEVLDLGITAGANRVMSLRFSARDTREARLEALQEAVRLAREEAEAMAAAAGVRLGPVLEIRGGATPEEPRVLYRAAASMEMVRADTPIEAGAQTVSANVTILYRILEEGR